MGTTLSRETRTILDSLAEDWKPAQIRDLAATLFRLADSIEQGWDGSNSQSIFRWPNRLHRIERNAVNLAWKAKCIHQNREKRRNFVPAALLAEPAWDMLLELFMQYAGGAKVSVKSLCHASHAPATTALRYIDELERLHLIRRERSPSDRRVSFLSLTDKGVLAMGSYLEEH